MTIVATAPGKAVLFGEYAVLFGAPAVVLAIDRRAVVRLEPAADGVWSFAAPGLVDAPVRAALDADGRPEWIDGDAAVGGRLALVEQVLASAVATGLVDVAGLPGQRAVLDTRSFFERSPAGPVKLGLGSSAALTTALVTALAAAAGRGHLMAPPLEWVRRVLAVHRRFQGGRGSGVDVAASVVGGVVAYRVDEHRTPCRADRLPLPVGLRVVPVWAGRSADTRAFLEHLDERLAGPRRRPIERAIGRLGLLTESATEALRSGATAAVLALADEFCDAMGRFGAEAGLAVLSGEHERLRDIVRGCGAHYKPSGAGGGDIGLALTDDPDVAERVAAAVRAHGFAVVAADVDPDGVECHVPT